MMEKQKIEDDAKAAIAEKRRLNHEAFLLAEYKAGTGSNHPAKSNTSIALDAN